jgi:hypothetical protein
VVSKEDRPVVDPDRLPPARKGPYVGAGVLLALPLIALLWVSSYAREEPRLGGFPFFFWYQFLWVLLAAVATSIAYRLVVGEERRRRAAAEDRR